MSSGALATRGFELETAVFLSLFLDAEARPEDQVPDSEPRRGWWGDAFAEVPGDKIGSRLWTKERSKATNQTLRETEQIALEALRWLITDGIAEKVVPAAKFEPDGFGGKRGMIAIDVYPPDEVTPQSFGPWEVIRAV